MYKVKLIGNIIEPGKIHSVRTKYMPEYTQKNIECVFEQTDLSKVLQSLDSTDIYLFSDFNAQYFPFIIEIIKKSKHCIFISPHKFSLEQLNQMNQLSFESGSYIQFHLDVLFHPILLHTEYKNLIIKHIEVKNTKTGDVSLPWESLQEKLFQAIFFIFEKNKSNLKHLDVIQHAILSQSPDFISIGMQFDDNNTASIQYGTGINNQEDINIFAENIILNVNQTNYSITQFSKDENERINSYVNNTMQLNSQLSVVNMIYSFVELIQNKNKCNSLENIIQSRKCMNKIIEKLRIN